MRRSIIGLKCFNLGVKLCIMGYLLSTVLLSSCSYFEKNSAGNDILARVGDKVLLRSDVENVMSEFSGMSDSIEMAKSFINSWAKKQLLIAEAEKYTSEQKFDFSQQLEDYKNSLLIYAYESGRADKELDTTVTSDDINVYYDANKEQFAANESQFKGIYLKISNDSLKSVKKRLNTLISGSPENLNMDRIELFCTNSAADYIITTNKYTPLQTIVNKIPLYTLDVKSLYQKQGLSEFPDDNYTHFIYVSDFIENGQTMPLELANKKVKSVILRQRRFEFLDRINKQLYEKAIENDEIELF